MCVCVPYTLYLFPSLLTNEARDWRKLCDRGPNYGNFMILSPSYNVPCGMKPHRKLSHGPTSEL